MTWAVILVNGCSPYSHWNESTGHQLHLDTVPPRASSLKHITLVSEWQLHWCSPEEGVTFAVDYTPNPCCVVRRWLKCSRHKSSASAMHHLVVMWQFIELWKHMRKPGCTADYWCCVGRTLTAMLEMQFMVIIHYTFHWIQQNWHVPLAVWSFLERAHWTVITLQKMRFNSCHLTSLDIFNVNLVFETQSSKLMNNFCFVGSRIIFPNTFNPKQWIRFA